MTMSAIPTVGISYGSFNSIYGGNLLCISTPWLWLREVVRYVMKNVLVLMCIASLMQLSPFGRVRYITAR